KKEEIYEGDMIIINHPYMGASHTPDILLYSPVFSEGELVAFCSTMCHHADVGGSVAGSSPSNATELFHEGVLLPPLKLYVKGKENKELISILSTNIIMTNYNLGDLNSKISSNKVVEIIFKSLIVKYSNYYLNSIIKI